VRYLGVHFNNKIMFRKYIEIRIALRWGVVNLIKKLSYNIGLYIKGIIKLIKIVLIPILIYRLKV